MTTATRYSPAHRVKYTSICIAHFYAKRLKCAETWITQFYLQITPCLHAFTPQPQNITAVWLVLILPSHGGRRLSLTDVRDRQTTTGAERRRTSRQRHAQVRPWTVRDFTCRFALARCGRSGPVQAWCYSPPMSSQQYAAVSGRLLRSSLIHRQSSATTFHTSLLADRTTPST